MYIKSCSHFSCVEFFCESRIMVVWMARERRIGPIESTEVCTVCVGLVARMYVEPISFESFFFFWYGLAVEGSL